MIMKEPRFWKYLIMDDDCNIIGIESDAPEDIKKEYEDWKLEEKANMKAGIKV